MNRLPEKYRAVVVLCDLEGRTHQEAARCLGWPIGTVKSRQSQGRGLLRDRLVRRGFGLGVVGAIVESLRQTAVAALPKGVSRNAVNAAMQQTARLLTRAGVSAQVLTLTERALQAMFWIRLRLLAVAALAVGIASSAATVYVSGSQEPALNGEQPSTNRPTTTTAPATRPKSSTNATAQPPADTQARLRAQQLATRKAKAVYEIARLTREIAEIAVEEYEEVIWPRNLAAAQDETKLAESDRTRSADRLDWARRMLKKGYVPKTTVVSEELSLKKARFEFEQAESRKKVLVEYTKSKTIKKLKSEVEKAKSDESAKKKALIVEQARELILEDQLQLGRTEKSESSSFVPKSPAAQTAPGQVSSS